MPMDIQNLLMHSFMGTCRTLMKVNVSTMKINIYKFEDCLWPTPDKEEDGIRFIRDYMSTGKIFREDLWQFEQLMDLETVVEQAFSEKAAKILTYRILRDGERIWMRLELMIPDDYSKENPEILLFNYDMNKKEAEFYEYSTALGSQILKVMKIDMTRKNLKIIKELPKEAHIKEKAHQSVLYEPDKRMFQNYVYPDDLEELQKRMKEEDILRQITDGNSSYEFFYRRKINQIYHWVKCMIIPSEDWSRDNLVFFCFIIDTNKEVLNLLHASAGNDLQKYLNGEEMQISEGHYRNIVTLLSAFTQNYLDYSVINLRREILVRFKSQGSFLDGTLPVVGGYNELFRERSLPVFAEEDREVAASFDTVEKLRNLMKDRVRAEFVYHYKDGKKIRRTFLKMESIGKIPTELVSYTELCQEESLLTIRTFGKFEVEMEQGKPVEFTRKQSKEIFAYLIDRKGYPVTSKELAADVLKKDSSDLKAIKYVSTLLRGAMKDLQEAGYPDVIKKDQKNAWVDISKVSCDYYQLMKGNQAYWKQYNNEYMTGYDWARATQDEILEYVSR